MSDDWQPGDLALCVNRHPLYPPHVSPGAVFTVEWVWRAVRCADDPDWIDVALDFNGIERCEGDNAYWHGNFRKIHPHVPDAEDVETIRLLTTAPEPIPA